MYVHIFFYSEVYLFKNSENYFGNMNNQLFEPFLTYHINLSCVPPYQSFHHHDNSLFLKMSKKVGLGFFIFNSDLPKRGSAKY